MGFFDKLKNGLSKTKNSFDEKINNVFSNFRKVDEELLDELEEALIMSDVGVETSTKIISNLRNRIKKKKIVPPMTFSGNGIFEIAPILELAKKSPVSRIKPSDNLPPDIVCT